MATMSKSSGTSDTLRDYNSEMAKLMTICTRSANAARRVEGEVTLSAMPT